MPFDNRLRRVAVVFGLTAGLVCLPYELKAAFVVPVSGTEGEEVVVPHILVVGPVTVCTVTVSDLPLTAWVDPSNPAVYPPNPGPLAYIDTAYIHWTPSYCDSGETRWLAVNHYAYVDGGCCDGYESTYYEVTVVNVNRLPILSSSVPAVAEYVGHPSSVSVYAFDPDVSECGDDAVNISSVSLPPSVTFTAYPGDSATLVWSSIPAGAYVATIVVQDLAGSADTLDIPFTVRTANVLLRNQNPTVPEGDSIAYLVWAQAQADGIPDPNLTVVLTLDSLPAGAVSIPDDSASGLMDVNLTVSWPIGFCDAGTHRAKYTARAVYDAVTLVSDVSRETHIVTNVNRPPIVSATSPNVESGGDTADSMKISVYQGVNVLVDFTATDADVLECADDALSYSVIGLPEGANFLDQGNGSASFAWDTRGDAPSVHVVNFVVEDIAVAKDTVSLRLTILPTGELNGDGIISATDIIFLVNYVFKSGPPATPTQRMDVNCDGVISNSSDILYLVNYIFKSGMAPCPAN